MKAAKKQTDKPPLAKVSAARTAAFEILRRVTTEDAFASHLLAAERYDRLAREDRALLNELVLGVLRQQGLLDYLIERYAQRPLSKLDPEVVIALRLGLYQLNFLTRIPAHAAINEAVNQVRLSRKQSAAAFVNAILRAAQREAVISSGKLADLLTAIADPIARLSVETSHPRWLIERWRNRLGADEAARLAASHNAAPPTAFRFNSRRATREQTGAWLAQNQIGWRASTVAPDAAIITSGHLSPQAQPLREGWIYLQDEASQLVAHLAAVKQQPADNAQQTLRVLDLCAAPGSKTMLLASLLPADTLLIAGELHWQRLQTMKELCARLGATYIQPLQLNALADLPFAETAGFDLILLDAPCTGLGTLQRHPEIKWRMTETKINELAELQKSLLENAARYLRPGGLLTYAVCSTEPEEGEEVIAWFRARHPEFRDHARERLTELGLEPTTLLTPSFGARTFTHRQGCESFFFCTLWKRR